MAKKVTTDNKRKATDDPDTPKSSKRVKSHATSPEQEKRMLKVVPFPEKVRPPHPSHKISLSNDILSTSPR
jgi:hypothetical protein